VALAADMSNISCNIGSGFFSVFATLNGLLGAGSRRESSLMLNEGLTSESTSNEILNPCRVTSARRARVTFEAESDNNFVSFMSTRNTYDGTYLTTHEKQMICKNRLTLIE